MDLKDILWSLCLSMKRVLIRWEAKLRILKKVIVSNSSSIILDLVKRERLGFIVFVFTWDNDVPTPTFHSRWGGWEEKTNHSFSLFQYTYCLFSKCIYLRDDKMQIVNDDTKTNMMMIQLESNLPLKSNQKPIIICLGVI